MARVGVYMFVCIVGLLIGVVVGFQSARGSFASFDTSAPITLSAPEMLIQEGTIRVIDTLQHTIDAAVHMPYDPDTDVPTRVIYDTATVFTDQFGHPLTVSAFASNDHVSITIRRTTGAFHVVRVVKL